MEISENGTLSVTIDLKQMCPNNCSGHGSCTNQGVCECDKNFEGSDCSLYLFDTPELTALFSNTTIDLSQSPFQNLIFSAIKFIQSNENSSLKYTIYVKFKFLNKNVFFLLSFLVSQNERFI